MSDQTSNLGFPFLAQGQAQKHVTVNESLLRLDALVQLVVTSTSVGTQPASPTDGALYILPAGKSGAAWSAMANGALAYYRDGAWEEIAPRTGWRAYVAAEGALYVFNGVWSPLVANPTHLLNGGFECWPRGATFTAAGPICDPWRAAITGGAVTIERNAFTPGQTDVPGEPEYYLTVDVSGQSAAGDCALVQNIVEGVRTLAGQAATLSFYAKRISGVGDLAVELVQIFNSATPAVTGIGAAKFVLTTSWQRFTHHITLPSITGATIGGGATYDALGAVFWASAGSSFNARTASLGIQTAKVALAQVKLEAGGAATALGQFTKQDTAKRLTRYYQAKTVRTENGSRHIPLQSMRMAPTIAVGVGTAVNVTADGFELAHTSVADCAIVADAGL